jgi:hypothetical protein
LITNTDREVLESIQSVYGGDLRPLAKREKNWKQGWQLRISWSNAVKFLSDIQPWLRIKAQQAAVAFAWDAIRPGKGKLTPGARQELSDAYELLQEYLSWLNAKGPRRTPDPLLAAMG